MKKLIIWPWSNHRIEKLRMELLRGIETQLNAHGIKTSRKRPGLRMEINGKDVRVWLTCYYDQRWWRITCGYGCDHPGFEYSICRFAELTMCRDEINGTTGSHLAAFLRDPENYRWPLFIEDKSRNAYPSYAWSRMGWQTIDAMYEEKKAKP